MVLEYHPEANNPWGGTIVEYVSRLPQSYLDGWDANGGIMFFVNGAITPDIKPFYNGSIVYAIGSLLITILLLLLAYIFFRRLR